MGSEFLASKSRDNETSADEMESSNGIIGGAITGDGSPTVYDRDSGSARDSVRFLRCCKMVAWSRES